MKLMLIGANGQLGSDIVRVFQEKSDIDLVSLTNKDIDITNYSLTEKVVKSHNPDIIINTAAFIQVDLCEDKVEEAFRVNTFAQKNLCSICKELNNVYMFFSTDYVFDGNKKTPYTEEDKPQPLSIYGISKLAGEQIVQYILDKYYIIRVSGLYGIQGPFGKKSNFVDIIVEKAKRGEDIRVVDDQRLTPTSTLDVANKLYDLIVLGDYGIYHMTNEGDCTWFEFTEEILKQCGTEVYVERAKTGDFGEKAKRPRYSVLDNKHLRTLGVGELPNWKRALSSYLHAKNYIN